MQVFLKERLEILLLEKSSVCDAAGNVLRRTALSSGHISTTVLLVNAHRKIDLVGDENGKTQIEKHVVEARLGEARTHDLPCFRAKELLDMKKHAEIWLSVDESG